ncbi:cytochrome c oxidase accessory protein CcoG [Kiritimatiellaeota bacterium B1221]|nr:cytochrome c oxidase accessory protein CcoG [Kiritimatiellaeota bacterium B1221]
MSDQPESFRDSIPTVDAAGKRVWMYPRKPPTGKNSSPDAPDFFKLRTWVSWILLVILVTGPFIKIAGNPLLMMNIGEGKFSIFGIMFWPQDFYLFALAMITGFVMIAFFTAAWGRIWCGWLCPQTVLMEMVFRKIEYAIEGDAREQKKLNEAPWTQDKITKKAIKHGIFFGLSFVVANLLLGYIIGGEALLDLISESPTKHTGGFFALLLFTGLFYSIFARFREQACTFVCPYGRFQSVLLDENTMVVAYDHVRGEKRARKLKGESWEERLSIGKGDCVDCNLCVTVCPTGIDIRNGTQMECVNCTNCIDACNSVMHKMKRNPGLIRFASMNQIEGKTKKRVFTPRLKAYAILMAALLVLLTGLLIARDSVEITMLRVRGTTFQVMPDGKVTNMFEARFMNKTGRKMDGSLKLLNVEGELLYSDQHMQMNPQEEANTIVVITLAPDQLRGKETRVTLGLMVDEKVVDTHTTNFLAPGGGS